MNKWLIGGIVAAAILEVFFISGYFLFMGIDGPPGPEVVLTVSFVIIYSILFLGFGVESTAVVFLVGTVFYMGDFR